MVEFQAVQAICVREVCSKRELKRRGLRGAMSSRWFPWLSPLKHERHFWLFRIFIFGVFFLLVHARLSFIYRE